MASSSHKTGQSDLPEKIRKLEDYYDVKKDDFRKNNEGWPIHKVTIINKPENLVNTFAAGQVVPQPVEEEPAEDETEEEPAEDETEEGPARLSVGTKEGAADKVILRILNAHNTYYHNKMPDKSKLGLRDIAPAYLQYRGRHDEEVTWEVGNLDRVELWTLVNRPLVSVLEKIYKALDAGPVDIYGPLGEVAPLATVVDLRRDGSCKVGDKSLDSTPVNEKKQDAFTQLEVTDHVRWVRRMLETYPKTFSNKIVKRLTIHGVKTLVIWIEKKDATAPL